VETFDYLKEWELFAYLEKKYTPVAGFAGSEAKKQ